MKRRAFLAVATGVVACAAAEDAVKKESSVDKPINFPIVDTHVHFWDPRRLRYPWLDGSALLNTPYLPADYLEAAGPYDIGQIVFVQAECIPDQNIAEVEWVTSLGHEEPRIKAIVAAAPLELGEGVQPVLERLAEHSIVKGIRRMLSGEPNAFLERPEFVKGVQLLGRVGFSFDLGLNRNQLGAAAQLARRCPDIQFMLNHIGVPDIKGGQMTPWREEIRALAELPNVYCKISGAATCADHASWTRDDLKPYLDHVIESFGFERIVFGSDWPVMLHATSLSRWIETVSWVVEQADAESVRRLFKINAENFYRLPTN